VGWLPASLILERLYINIGSLKESGEWLVLAKMTLNKANFK